MSDIVCVDTNVVVHYLLGDDPLLGELINKTKIDIPSQVWIECMYVMEEVYRISRKSMITTLRQLIGNDRIVSDKDMLEWIFDVLYENIGLSPVDSFLAYYVISKKLDLVTRDKKLQKFITSV
jgi:predicted nucleic acid-binding protein